MSQVTLYLDDETQRLMRECARAAGMSNSRWVASLIRKQALREWPASVRSLAGRFEDFPLAEAARASTGEDVERIGF
ncbi:MAG: CopG family transcriptional regulator [Gammaproteobacteria bacterium]